jgi:hypothetical protein
MTRKEQFGIFLPFFEAEEKRYAVLTQRATTFLGLTSVVILFGGVDAAQLPRDSIAFSLAIATAACLLFAVLGSIASLWIRTYKDVCDIEEIVVIADEQEYSEEDIYSVLLADMADAVRHNRAINTKRANWLQFSATCFAVAITLAAMTSLEKPYEKPRSTVTARTHA